MVRTYADEKIVEALALMSKAAKRQVHGEIELMRQRVAELETTSAALENGVMAEMVAVLEVVRSHIIELDTKLGRLQHLAPHGRISAKTL
jgi:hypothetical protein